MKKGLNTTQLKIIAIMAMVCDHVAWGFVEMFSVQGQIMHTIGRLTIPIMCYFIAEGYRKTSNLKKYIYRMVIFSLISVVPFFLFFGEEYGYRQNIIFDLLLALLTLVVIDRKEVKKPLKVLLTIALFAVSFVIGGWPVLPILFVLIFYYGKSFRQKATLICGTTVFLEVFMICIILLNNRYHFSHYDWVWYQWFYFLGFMLALPVLKLYNGEKGNYPLGKYFFYLFYPGHFLFLYSIKQLNAGNLYTVYLLVHILSLVCAIAIVIKLIFSRPSRALTISITLVMSGIIYIFGFILEIYSGDVDIAYAGTVMQYFGECLISLSFIAFTAEMCRKKLPYIIYYLAGFLSMIIIYLIMTTRETESFYTYVGMDTSGPFPKLVLEYGVGFYIFFAYVLLACGGSILLGLFSLKHFFGIDKKRIQLVLLSILCPWFAFMLKVIGLTGGYEISAIGVLGSLFLIYRAIVHYEFFDSIQLAGENALHHFGDGILVVNSMNMILYINKKMQELFPNVKENTKATQYEEIKTLLDRSENSFSIDGIIYEATITPLEEHGYIQGYMLSTKDMTEHYEHLREAERFAHTDTLTGLSNRAYFKQCFDEYRSQKGIGCMLMFDLDNFKGVNDNYGHGTGDKVLLVLAETLQNAANNTHLSCRLGGDEFCMFLKNIISEEDVKKICMELINDFPKRLAQAELAGVTSISVGAAILSENNKILPEDDFKNIYKCADSALYKAKNSGKATYCIYKQEM